MSDFKCKCGNTSDFFIEHNLSQCGLYCGECGKWIKWLNKDEERLFKHKHSNADVIEKELQRFAMWLWDNHYLVDEALTIRLVQQYKSEQMKEQNIK